MAGRSDARIEEREFVISRTFDAPRELVFEAWTDPKHVAGWWGPRFFTARCEVDLRPGGAYRFVMVGPDGGEYPMKGKYVEVARPGLLSFTLDHSEHPEAWHDLVDPHRDKRKGPRALETLTTVTFD